MRKATTTPLSLLLLPVLLVLLILLTDTARASQWSITRNSTLKSHEPIRKCLRSEHNQVLSSLLVGLQAVPAVYHEAESEILNAMIGSLRRGLSFCRVFEVLRLAAIDRIQYYTGSINVSWTHSLSDTDIKITEEAVQILYSNATDLHKQCQSLVGTRLDINMASPVMICLLKAHRKTFFAYAASLTRIEEEEASSPGKTK